MNDHLQSARPWFKDPRVLLVGAIGAAAIALVGAAVGIASARTDNPATSSVRSYGELSVEMEAPRDSIAEGSAQGRLETLDPTALRDQSIQPVAADPEGDENLRLIDAQERRLQAVNDREAAAFAAQMRQSDQEDGAMEREVRTNNAESPAHGSTTSNSTDPD